MKRVRGYAKCPPGSGFVIGMIAVSAKSVLTVISPDEISGGMLAAFLIPAAAVIAAGVILGCKLYKMAKSFAAEHFRHQRLFIDITEIFAALYGAAFMMFPPMGM